MKSYPRPAPPCAPPVTVVVLGLALLGGVARAQAPPPPGPPVPPSAEDLAKIAAGLADLERLLAAPRRSHLPGKGPWEGPFAPGGATRLDEAGAVADVAVFAKAVRWLLRHPEEFYTDKHPAMALAALAAGRERALALARVRRGDALPWGARTGRLVRGYRSRVDGSVQPYGLRIPRSYDGRTPMRLDVVLHGRQNTLSEVSFIHEHDDASKPAAAGGRDVIVLSVFGRTNNAYRWAGETDVFEAIASVVDRYNIDPAKIVLRGFSMGGAGAWHMGLHHPDRWAAIEAGAGFTDTKLYAKATDLPPHQEATLRIYDAVDWADNAFNVPLVGYGGELDRQLAAATNIRTALERTGYAFAPEGNGWRGKDIAAIFLVGARTGHEFHRDSKRASDQFIDAALARRNLAPRAIRFVTYTTKYDRAYWVRIDGMEAHYHRAEVDAQLGIGHLPAPTGTGAPKAGPRADMVAATVKTSNVSRLVLTGEAAAAFLTIDGQALPPQTGGGPGEAAVLEKRDGAWIGRPVIPGLSGSEPARRPGRREPTARSLRKRRGLTGPIDDAFTDAFLVVRPTGRSPHAGVSSFTTTALDRFIAEWDKWMRGDVRIKDDRAVTAGDIAAHNLILFGDPSSNAILRRIIAKLPVTWSKGQVGFGKKRFDAGRFVPVLIYPNPLNPDRYVVINSGHTFHEAEFRGTNALLYPRLGDYAVLGTDGAIALAGLFDDDWMLPGP